MKVVELEKAEREALYPERATLWHGPRTPAQYLERNRRMDAMPYARTRIQAFALKDDRGRVLSSLDRLLVPMAIEGETKMAGLIASFFTPPELRRHGYGKLLIRGLLEREADRDYVLFSEIAPEYYAALGFRPCPRAEGPPPAAKERIPLGAFLEELTARRLKMPAALVPDPEYVEWHLARFRYFSELENRPFEVVATRDSLTAGGTLLWSTAGTDTPGVPMVRSQRILTDVQLLDAW